MDETIKRRLLDDESMRLNRDMDEVEAVDVQEYDAADLARVSREDQEDREAELNEDEGQGRR